MADFLESTTLEWLPVRPEVTEGVLGSTLHDGPAKVVLTRVAPGGGFLSHVDPYGHLLSILHGRCLLRVGTEERDLLAGAVVRIAPGEPHGYRNTGEEELLVLSMNLPERA